MMLDYKNKVHRRLGRSDECNSEHSQIIAGELFLAEEAANQPIINGKIGPAGYMIQHPC
jgi:hypothetical protein